MDGNATEAEDRIPRDAEGRIVYSDEYPYDPAKDEHKWETTYNARGGFHYAECTRCGERVWWYNPGPHSLKCRNGTAMAP